MNKAKALKVLQVLNPDQTKVDFSQFDSDIQKLKNSLKEKITVKTLEDVNVQLERFKRRLDFEPVTKELQNAKTDVLVKLDSTIGLFQKQILEFQNQASDTILQISQQQATNEASVSHLTKSLENFKSESLKLVSRLDKEAKDSTEVFNRSVEDLKAGIEEAKKQTGDVEKKLTQKINSKGGGSQPFQVNVNSSVATVKFADVNFLAGTNVTLNSANNNTTKQTDITINSQGGGGGSAFGIIGVSGQSSVIAGQASDTMTFVAGSNMTITTSGKNVTFAAAGASSTAGVSRTTSIITANTTGGNTSATDYVYFANAGLAFTLPTAIGNQNLYTIKNTAVSSVLVQTSAGQTIDGSSTALLATQYQSLDLISNGSVWSVI